VSGHDQGLESGFRFGCSGFHLQFIT